MGTEIDLLKNYPRTKRDPGARGATKTEEDRAIARQFGKDFFDIALASRFNLCALPMTAFLVVSPRMEAIWLAECPFFQSSLSFSSLSGVQLILFFSN